VVTSNTILGKSLAEKLRASNPSPPEIDYNAFVAHSRKAGFRFTADDFCDATYGPAGQRLWGLADEWVDEVSNFLYSADFALDDNPDIQDAAQPNYKLRRLADGCD
jgi:hypothetical protein